MSVYLRAGPADPKMEKEFPPVFGGPFGSKFRARNYARVFRRLAQARLDVPIRLQTKIVETDEDIVTDISYRDCYAALRRSYAGSQQSGASVSDEEDESEGCLGVRQGALQEPVLH